jgi:hypothetical protein
MTDEQRARLAAVAAEDRYVRGVRSYCEKAGGFSFSAKDSYVLQRSVELKQWQTRSCSDHYCPLPGHQLGQRGAAHQRHHQDEAGRAMAAGHQVQVARCTAADSVRTSRCASAHFALRRTERAHGRPHVCSDAPRTHALNAWDSLVGTSRAVERWQDVVVNEDAYRRCGTADVFVGDGDDFNVSNARDAQLLRAV